MGGYSMIANRNDYTRALDVAKGSYQANVLRGVESLSGATLKGKARRFGGKYAESRRNLLGRLTATGVAWREVKASHGKRVLVIGAGPVGSDAGATCT